MNKKVDCNYATLEDLMRVFTKSRGRLFKHRVRPCKDGSFDPFTPAGARAYRELVNFVYAVHRLAGHDGGDDIVDTLDAIANEDVVKVGPYAS